MWLQRLQAARNPPNQGGLWCVGEFGLDFHEAFRCDRQRRDALHGENHVVALVPGFAFGQGVVCLEGFLD